MKTIGVATFSRAEYGLYRPILQAIRQAPDLRLFLIAGGAHMATGAAGSRQEILADGFTIDAQVDCRPATDNPWGVADAMGRATAGLAQVFAHAEMDFLLLLGDRFEMLAAAAAAVPFGIPLAHLHGGEITEGAMDDQFRHAITKLSHLHFAATAEYARRIRQMGEEDWRVTVSGAPGLDNLRTLKLLEPAALGRDLGLDLAQAPLVVTWHPATRAWQESGAQAAELLAALEGVDRPMVFTHPNVDMGSQPILAALKAFVAAHPACRLVENLGTVRYFSLLQCAAAMVGNSSSGLIEAPSFELPVVNVGDRQRGRARGRNVLDAPCDRAAICAALDQALQPEFRAGLRGVANPYGDGHAAERIVRVLQATPRDARLLWKKFRDEPGA